MKDDTIFRIKVSSVSRTLLVILVLVNKFENSFSFCSTISITKRGRCERALPYNKVTRAGIKGEKRPLKQNYMSSTESSSSPDSTSSLDTASRYDCTTKDRISASVVPSYRKLLVFTGTTVLIWLSGPLLSLVDTTVVGRSSATSAHTSLIELAALGPATMLIDSGIYITYFLAIATTNVMAKSLAKRDLRALRRHSSHVLGVASVLGAIITVVVFGLGKPLLKSWTAGTSSSQQLVQAAFSYAKIRSVVAPLVIMDLVAQSICLACLDTTTPAVAVAVASTVNILGDIFLVSECGMGIQGAAIATAIASVSSSAVLLRQIKKKMRVWKEQEQQVVSLDLVEELVVEGGKNDVESEPASEDDQALNGTFTHLDADSQNGGVASSLNAEDHNGEEAITGTGAVDPGSALKTAPQIQDINIPFVSFPDRKALFKLVRLSGPICFVIVGKIVCYSAMTLSATDFGVLSLASHNVMMRVFFFFATFGDSISQAAQTFVPQVLYKGKGDPQEEGHNKIDLKQLLLRLGVLSICVGAVSSNFAGWVLTNCGSSFSKDPAISNLMGKHTRFFVLSLFFHPFIMLFEGALIATRDLAYLVGNYAITMCLLGAQLKFACNSFGGVWRALFVFQTLRLVQFSTRFFNKTVRKEGRITGE